MIVISIIALLAVIMTGPALRARKRSQATHMLEDLRTIDAAIDQYALDNNKGAGVAVNWTDIQTYLKRGAVLYNSNGNDLMANPYNGGAFTVDGVPKLSLTTFNKLSDSAPGDFWSPFY